MKASPQEAIDRVQAGPSEKRWSVGPAFDRRIRKLVRDWGTPKVSGADREMITTAPKIARDEMNAADRVRKKKMIGRLSTRPG